MPVATPQGTLDFKSVDKVTFVGASSNTVIDTTTGSLGVGVGVGGPTSKLHVVGNAFISSDLTVSGTGALTVPNGTTGDRPAAATGMIRYNSTTGFMEAYAAAGWAPIAQPPTVTGISPLTTLPSGGNVEGYSSTPTEMPQPPNAVNGDKLGWSVAVSGNGMYALAGSPYDDGGGSGSGALHIYVRNASTNAWTHQQELAIPSITGGDSWGYTQHALSLSNDGTYAVAGAQYHNGQTGRARVWVRNETSWTHQQELTISSMPGGAYFGSAVDISEDGNYIIIGAYSDDVLRNGAGAAHIFIRSNTTWTHQATLPRTGDGASGDQFGVSVGISSDGTYAIVGSPYGTPNTGSAHIYIRSVTTWTHQKLMVDPNGQSGDAFGHGVHISGDGNYAAIGAHNDNSNTGAGFVFVRNGTSWTLQPPQLTITSAATGDYAFEQLKLSQDGTVLVVSVRARKYSGTVYGSFVIFNRVGTTWSQTKEILGHDLPNPASDDILGYCVDISSDGKTIIAGAYGRDTGGTDRGAMFSVLYREEIIDASTQVFTATGTGIVSGSTVQLEGADGSLYSVVDATAPNAAGTQVTFKMGPYIALSSEFPPSAMTSDTSITGYTVSTSYNNYPYKAFDDNNSLYWDVNNSGYDTTTPFLATVSGALYETQDISGTTHRGHWIQLQIPSSVVLTRTILQAPVGADHYAYGQFAILGSNDGTNWTLLHSGTSTTLATDVTTLSAGSLAPFKYFRVVIKSKRNGNGSGQIRVSNIQFFGGTPSWSIPNQPYKVKVNSTSGLTGTSTAAIGFAVGWTSPAAGATLIFDTDASTTHTLVGTDGGGGANISFSVAPSSTSLPSGLTLIGSVITGTIGAAGPTSVTFRLTDNASGLFTDRAINIVGVDELFSFTSHTFTDAGAGPGRLGPTFAQMKSTYSSEIWEQNPLWFNEISGKQGFQLWTIPKSGTYRITAKGGKGGKGNPSYNSNYAGRGGTVRADIAFTVGTKIVIIVGQWAHINANRAGYDVGGGGGGATWVLKPGAFTSTDDIYLVAGGGAGAHSRGGSGSYASDGGNSQASVSDTGGGETSPGDTTRNVGGGAGWGTDGEGIGFTGSDYGGGGANTGYANYPEKAGGISPARGAMGGYKQYDQSNPLIWQGEGGFGGGGAASIQGEGGGGGFSGGNACYATSSGALAQGGTSYIMPNGTGGVTVTNRLFQGTNNSANNGSVYIELLT